MMAPTLITYATAAAATANNWHLSAGESGASVMPYLAHCQIWRTTKLLQRIIATL